MLLRALGIGPAGSLLAAGRIDAREPLLVTDFSVTNADSALGKVLSDATKTTLAQSSVINLLSPEAVGAALARMERPRTSTIDLTLAREMATRDGIKAIVDGQVNGLGTGAGYIVTLRLVTVDSLKELASFRESAKDAQGLIDVIDKLSRQLRGKIGESLRDVHSTPSLARVTTSSFAALQKYTAGDRAEAIEANRPKAIGLLEEAVAIDSTFAEAWRRLGIVRLNAGRPRSEVDHAYAEAYRFRHRASDIERLIIEANYFSPGPGRDRARAIVAYEELLRRGHWRSMNNFALRLQSRREFARAESVWRVAIREGDMIDRPLVLNPLRSLLIQHKFAAAESLIARAESLYPDLRGVWRARIDMLSMRGDTTAYRRAVDSVAQHGDSLDKVWAGTKRSQLATVAGRLRDGIRMFDEGRPSVNTLNARQRLTRTLQLGRSWLRSQYLNEAAQHVKELDAALAALPMTSLPEQDRPYFTANGVIWNYAVAGRPDRARAALAEYDATVRDSILRLDQSNDRHNALGDILLAEGKPVEAIAEYRAGDRLPDGPAGSCTMCLSLNLARAFDAAGMTDSAIVHYERIVSDEYPFRVIEWVDALFTPLSYRRLGALYESKKDYAKAATNYQKFVTLWANAEPDVQPLVEEARLRLRRMANVER